MAVSRSLRLLLVTALLVGACTPTHEAAGPRPVTPFAPPMPLLVWDANIKSDDRGTPIRMLDALTLTDVQSAPFDIRLCTDARLSPDGSRLAVLHGLRHDMGCNDGGVEIRLFDVHAWRWSETLPVDGDAFSLPTWSADGRRLFVLGQDRERSAQGGLGGSELQRLWLGDLDTGHVRSAPLGFAVQRIDPAPDGSVLYVLGYDLDPTNRAWLAKGPAFLSVLSAESGVELDRLTLDGVLIGQGREPTGLGYPTYRPAAALSVDGRRYYVARSDEPILEVIDLERLRIDRQVRLEERDLLERLLDLISQPAMAKMGPSGQARIGLDPSGERVYVTGHTTTLERLSGNEAREVVHPRGLFEVSTKDWSVRLIDEAANDVTVSPDGRWLFARQPSLPDNSHVATSAAPMGSGVRVIATGTHAEAVRLEPRLAPHAVLAGDELVYLITGTDVVAYRLGTWEEHARRTGIRAWGFVGIDR